MLSAEFGDGKRRNRKIARDFRGFAFQESEK
jgi:hypothetical protein